MELENRAGDAKGKGTSGGPMTSVITLKPANGDPVKTGQ
jgi:hypothetical protein